MNITAQTNTSSPRRLAVMALTVIASLALPLGMAVGGDGGIKVAFKLDPRLTHGVYMGERWVTPTAFIQVQEGDQMIVAAKSNVATTWAPADPAMVTITPIAGTTVAITINYAGATILTVGDKALSVQAEQITDGILKVQISQ